MKRYRDERQDTSQGSSLSKRQKVSSFDVWPRNRFERAFPKYEPPREIGKFSLNEQRIFVHDASRLRYFYNPEKRLHHQKSDGSTSGKPEDAKKANENVKSTLSLNLRDGYKIFIERDESVKEHIDDLLRWILLNKAKVVETSTDSQVSTDFVCWRGLMTKILCTPYENREGWKIAAARYRNCIYLCEYDTHQKLEDKRCEEPRQKEMTYWGLKFEQYVTTDSKDGIPNTEKPVNSNEAYVTVVRTSLNKHSLVFGGEVDCREGNEYIELKTSREMSAPNHYRNFKRFKLIKWWAQSFLVGIERVVCGFRDDSGVVKFLETFKTKEIPKYCSDINDHWKGTVCFNFCDEFLKFIKDSVQLDHDKAIYVFEWMPRQPVSYTVEKPDSEYAFLPRWYTDDFERCASSNSIDPDRNSSSADGSSKQ